MRLLIILMALCGVSAAAQDTNPLTFQAWKEQQVLEAQNQVLRVSARISQLKTGGRGQNSHKETSTQLPNSKVKKAETDTVTSAERDLRRAQESLQTANTLTMDEYINVYLPTLQSNPEAIQLLSQKLSKEELAEIFRGLMKRDPPNDTKRSSSLPATGLTVTSRAKAP